MSWCAIGAAVSLVAALAGATHAQTAQPTPPFDSAIDLQTFEYAIGPKTFVTVADGDVIGRGQTAVDALITFLTKPFTVYDVDPASPNRIAGARTTVVSSMTSAQLTAAYGATDRLQLGANLPIVFALQGDGLMPETGSRSASGLHVSGLGDLIGEAKYRLVRGHRLGLSAIGGLSLPTSIGSGGSQFLGDDLPTVRGKLAAQVDLGRISLGANAGVILRKPRTIYDSTIGQQLVWGVAGAARITDRLSVVAEGYGRAGLPGFAIDASPLEVEGGLRFYATGAIAVVAGGGAGVIKGIGAPEARFFLSIGLAPDIADSDGDGIPNHRDRCPLVPEDRDGFEDEDGCPDPDNDHDGIPDAEDRCPNQREDIDGFEDEDGCPDPDNDHDGIPDLDDKCPDEPEDGKPPFPHDGCPVRPATPEPPPEATAAPAPAAAPPAAPTGDLVGEIDLACPEPDRDHDGIPDAQDRCPDQSETVNGVEDDDGCPDTGGVQVARLAGDRLTIARVPTLDGDELSRGGQIIVDQIALVMRGHAEVTRWLVAIGQPSQSDARKLADAVKARLVARGVRADRLEILAAAGASRIGGIAKQRAPTGGDPACGASPAARPPPAAQPRAKRRRR
ncbi:MAG TPA: thrombospondin type 3 repeat-containing protein [Kofleriaceae bacterium]|nr:thrombospondin type 3 repeat-containing protein [Kofleriaceae bacterium]